jgi:hypothetical protein
MRGSLTERRTERRQGRAASPLSSRDAKNRSSASTRIMNQGQPGRVAPTQKHSRFEANTC